MVTRCVPEERGRIGLRDGLGVDDANDLLWTINHPTVFHMLVTERGWSTEKYRDWLAETLRQQLLKR